MERVLYFLGTQIDSSSQQYTAPVQQNNHWISYEDDSRNAARPPFMPSSHGHGLWMPQLGETSSTVDRSYRNPRE